MIKKSKTKKNNAALPEYMKIFTNKIYQNSSLSSVCDDNRVAAVMNLGADRRLVADLLKDVTKNAHVLQIGIVFGSEISAVYEKVSRQGKFDIFDVSETQLQLARKRYAHHNINFYYRDAAQPWTEKYDVIICYNLLHELPLQTRQKVMDNVLSSLTNGGKAVFVDCAAPYKWNLLRWPLLWFNRLYRPFAESLWQQPLESFASLKSEFRWHHTYYYGHMYQKVVAVRKILSSEDVLKLTKIFREK